MYQRLFKTKSRFLRRKSLPAAVMDYTNRPWSMEKRVPRQGKSFMKFFLLQLFQVFLLGLVFLLPVVC